MQQPHLRHSSDRSACAQEHFRSQRVAFQPAVRDYTRTTIPKQAVAADAADQPTPAVAVSKLLNSQQSHCTHPPIKHALLKGKHSSDHAHSHSKYTHACAAACVLSHPTSQLHTAADALTPCCTPPIRPQTDGQGHATTHAQHSCKPLGIIGSVQCWAVLSERQSWRGSGASPGGS